MFVCWFLDGVVFFKLLWKSKQSIQNMSNYITLTEIDLTARLAIHYERL